MKNDLTNELGTNFIEYAVAVNTDRALPDSKSGLKPVARRILWSAFENGRLSSKPHVKTARVVGDVMGQYHPHGDSSIYGAIVRLSQGWVMRYPLIDWHGNNGNIAGDGPAHMRYTEARLSKIAEDGLLKNIKKKNVDFIPNFDETLEEPITLPAVFPNLLCNPNTGIGVAMACNWLPHNLKEVAQAIYDYMEGKEPMLPGPDFPTGGIVINKNDIPNIMKSGHGSVKVRGKYKIEKQNIIFYEIPYGTSIENLLNEIGTVCEKKEIEGIEEIRDESNKKGLRIVIECEKNINPENIVKKLFQHTNLQTSISYNQVALVDKTPTELNLKDCIEIYLKHNRECLLKETQYDLDKAQARLEIVKGLLIALEDIDNVIALIKKSENATVAKDNLIKKYDLTENQAKAILGMKLSSLAKLEKMTLQNEEKDLYSSIENYNNILTNEKLQNELLKERIETIVKKYGDDRRTELMQIDIKPEDKEIETVIPEDVVVMVTQSGEIKRIPKKSFRAQKRNGKGIKSVNDIILTSISTNTIDNVLIFTNSGKMYKILVDNIPVGTNVSKGESIYNLINIPTEEKIIAATSMNRDIDKKYAVFITKQGLFKKTLLEEYKNIKKATGIQAIKLKDNDSIAKVFFMNEENFMIFTKNGIAIKFDTKDIKPIGRVTSGVKAIKLNDDDYVISGFPITNEKANIAIIGTNGYGKKCSLEDFNCQGKGGKGVKTNFTIAGAELVEEDKEILLIGSPNSICISEKELPLQGRANLGVKIAKNNINNILIV